jgi:SAM-dependent methyltransferase/alkylhydroperoxidase family enzyme
MTGPPVSSFDHGQWKTVDEGWGRKAVEFATLSEPGNCREYVTVHQYLGVGDGDKLLDIACGAGLSVELAGLRGAQCAGIDASPRLIAVARDRSPAADLRVGDMNALPWDDDAFDLVTSFRGIWGTTPHALTEALRVLVPGGRIGLTVWGHIKASPGAWAFAPFTLAETPKVENQAAMVALGRPGAGEALLHDIGFTDIERIDVPFVLESPDPETYARALASTGPAFEAIQAAGEDAFRTMAVELAQRNVREGLPLRAPLALVGYIAAKPAQAATGEGRASNASRPAAVGFLSAAPQTPAARRLMDEDLNGAGYVTNVSRLWSHLPSTLNGLADLMAETTDAASLSYAQRAVLVTAAASALGDSYCSLAWGKKLADATSPAVAASVIGGGSEGLDDESLVALAGWARQIARRPNEITADDVQALRDVGFDDARIFALTTFVALRLAFATVNDALGASPDLELQETVPDAVRSAVTFGRSSGSSEKRTP